MEIPRCLDTYVNDYQMHVFEVAWLTEEQISHFHSDFKVVANFFVQKRKNKDYIPDDPTEIRHVDEVLKLLQVMTRDRRYEEIFRKKKEEVHKKCIVTSNIPAYNVYLQTKYRDLLCNIEAVKDNAGLMAIKFFAQMGVKKIYLAGFDGYSHDEKENYGEFTMAFVTRAPVLDAMNQGMTEMMKKYSELVELNFLTKPHYVKI